jgi:tripartite-type tricarboxylate transporter receptor subunit TctC
VDKVIKAQSFEPVITTRSEFISFLKNEELRWGQLVRESGVKAE